MKLKKFEISVPIFLYINKVTHFFSRRPVAIEWAIVESINRFGEDDVFIWGIIMGPDAEDGIRYVLVDWKKDGKSYRYEN